MFSEWKQEKAVAGLVEAAQALADRLDGAKPHIVESHAAAARFWAASFLAEGQDLHQLSTWPAGRLARFVSEAEGRIAALRKARAYDSSDGLAVWLHTARAVSEPRVAPPVIALWQHLLEAGPNADSMAAEQIEEAGLPADPGRRVPVGFAPAG